MSPLRVAIIPAAGLGTRLRPLTPDTPKELLPVGGRPAIAAVLLEAVRAGVDEVVVVVSPAKVPLRRWLEGRCGAGLRIRIVEQPEPVGVIDAIERGRALLDPSDEGGFAVLYPDQVHLPDQSALSQLRDARRTCGGSVIGLHLLTSSVARVTGHTLRAVTEPISGGLHRIERFVMDSHPRIGALHGTFGSIRGRAHLEAQAQVAGDGRMRDELNIEIFNRVARAGKLFGQVIAGNVLDVGVLGGYENAVDLFARGGARWRR